MNELIKQAARRLGVWYLSPPVGVASTWSVWREEGTLATRRHIDAPTAALFLLLLGLPEATVSCPDCRDRGCRHEECEPPYGDRLGPEWEVMGGTRELGTRTWSRPCPTCSVDGQPLGKVQREPARLLLDAMECHACDGDGINIGQDSLYWAGERDREADPCDVCHGEVDPVAREALAVLADDLQQRGDPRGTWLALWLLGEVETVVDGDTVKTIPVEQVLPEIKDAVGEGARYAVHPAEFARPSVLPISANATEMKLKFRRVEPPELAKLYGLRDYEWIPWDTRKPETIRGRSIGVYVHLTACDDGHYAERMARAREQATALDGYYSGGLAAATGDRADHDVDRPGRRRR